MSKLLSVISSRKNLLAQLSFILTLLFSVNLVNGQENEITELWKQSERDTLWINKMFFEARRAYPVSINSSPDSLLLIGNTLFQRSQQLNYEQGKYYGLLLKAIYYRLSDRDSLFYYHRKGEKLVSRENVNLKLVALSNVSKQHNRFSQHDSARIYAERGLLLANEHNQQRYIAENHRYIGRALRALGDFPGSLYHYRQALITAENLNSGRLVIQILRGMAVVYDDVKGYQEAYNLLMRSIELEREVLGDAFQINRTSLNNLGRYLTSLGQYDSAFHYLHRAMKAYEQQLPGDCQIMYPQYNLGNTFLAIDELDSAHFFLKRAVENARQCEDNYVLSLASYDFGEVYRKRGKSRKSLRLIKEAYSIAKSRGKITTELINASFGLYRAYRAMGDNTTALRYHEEWSAAKDSLFNEEKRTELALQEADYRFEKEKNALIADQEQQKLTLENELQRQEAIQWGAFIVIITVLIFMIYVTSLLQKKKKANKLISEQNLQISKAAGELEKLSNFKEGLTNMIAHDMKNSLSTIINVSHEDKVLDKKRVERIRQAGGNVLNLVTTMLDVQKFEEAKFQLNKERSYISFIFSYAHEQVISLLQGKSIQLITQGNETVALEIDQEVMGRVMVNLLVNAIKFSDNGKQIIMEAGLHLNSQTPEMIVSVIDTGTGIAASDLPYIFDKFRQAEARSSGRVASTGLGLTFCKLAIEAHGGRIWAESEPGKGTRVSFSIPVLDNSVEINGAESGPLSMAGATTRSIDMEESLVLKKYAVRMQTMGVHEIKKLRTVLNELEEENPDSEWSSDLWSAILQGNKERYQYLLNKVLNEEVST